MREFLDEKCLHFVNLCSKIIYHNGGEKMIKWTEDDDKRLMPFIEEFRKYDEMYGTMSEEEFWIRWEKCDKKI